MCQTQVGTIQKIRHNVNIFWCFMSYDKFYLDCLHSSVGEGKWLRWIIYSFWYESVNDLRLREDSLVDENVCHSSPQHTWCPRTIISVFFVFQVVGEIEEIVKTGLWVGDCFIYTNSVNRLNYYVGGEIVTISHLDRWVLISRRMVFAEPKKYQRGQSRPSVFSETLVQTVQKQALQTRSDNKCWWFNAVSLWG